MLQIIISHILIKYREYNIIIPIKMSTKRLNKIPCEMGILFVNKKYNNLNTFNDSTNIQAHSKK